MLFVHFGSVEYLERFGRLTIPQIEWMTARAVERGGGIGAGADGDRGAGILAAGGTVRKTEAQANGDRMGEIMEQLKREGVQKPTLDQVLGRLAFEQQRR